MKTHNVIWLSRHPMTAEQRGSLEALLGGPVQVEVQNLTWQATADAAADLAHNAGILEKFLGDGRVVAGVFPPVALEAVIRVRLERGAFPLYTPVSEQSATLRADGSRQIGFHHVRWARI